MEAVAQMVEHVFFESCHGTLAATYFYCTFNAGVDGSSPSCLPKKNSHQSIVFYAQLSRQNGRGRLESSSSAIGFFEGCVRPLSSVG